MAQWNGFGTGEYHPQNTDLRNACFAHFDHDRDGVLNEAEFHNLCCDLFTIDGRSHVVSKTDSMAMMKFLGGEKGGQIGMAEFEFCWKDWFSQVLSPRAALIVVDVQNDFIDGSLALRTCAGCQDGAEVIPVINELVDLKFEVVVYAKDYHPANHMSFFDNLSLRKFHSSSKVKSEDAKLFDTVVFDRLPLVDQIMWPTHCVESTHGAEFHPDLKIVQNHLVHLKGTDPEVESYSVFIDNTKRTNTSLISDLQTRDITDVYVCGLAFDICVGMTATDAQSFGYRTMVIEDATRAAAGLEKIKVTRQGLLKAGCLVGKASEVPAMLSKRTRHPQWGLAAARVNAVKARSPMKGRPGISAMDSNQNEDVTLSSKGITA